jgi:hypothetical protein
MLVVVPLRVRSASFCVGTVEGEPTEANVLTNCYFVVSLREKASKQWSNFCGVSRP